MLSYSLLYDLLSALQYFTVPCFATSCFAVPISSASCFAADCMLFHASLLDVLLPKSCFIASRAASLLYASLLRCSMLCCSMLRCHMLFCSIFHCFVFCCSLLRWFMLFCLMLFCSMLFCSMLFYSILCYSGHASLLIHPYNQMCYSLCSLTLFASMLCAQQCWLLQFCWKRAKQCHSVCCSIIHLMNANHACYNKLRNRLERKQRNKVIMSIIWLSESDRNQNSLLATLGAKNRPAQTHVPTFAMGSSPRALWRL